MKVIETKIPGVLIVETDVFGDHRGYFTEKMCIRDSSFSLSYGVILQSSLAIVLSLTLGFSPHPCAVSYTHLDVYKRQHRGAFLIYRFIITIHVIFNRII